MIACAHPEFQRFGRNRNGSARLRCKVCGKTFTEPQEKPLGKMTVSVADAKMVLRLLVEGSSLRSASRITGINRGTICKLLVTFGTACQRFLDGRMQGLKLTHLQFDEQWTYVEKKQSRLTINERAERHDIGDVYLWTCIDQKTKLMPSFLIGKRSADSARRFMTDVASRLVFPNPHASDAHAYQPANYLSVVQISTDGFKVYPEAVDLAFGPYVRYGTIVKEYRNANIIYTPSEMVGTQRKGVRGIEGRQVRTICTSHVERLNGTQRLFLKRLNRLTLCFSKKLENLEAAFAMFAAWYNFVWQTREKGNSGKLRPSAAMMAGLEGHVWSFDELFSAVLV
jgi:IS1 family transposase/transposase-like protein